MKKRYFHVIDKVITPRGNIKRGFEKRGMKNEEKMMGAFFAARPQKTGLSAAIFFAAGGKKGFPLQSLARSKSLRLQGFDSRNFAPKKKLHPARSAFFDNQ
jgi:hypothetical protein